MKLVCWLCSREYPADAPATLCECGKPLRVEYGRTSASIQSDVHSLWRYAEMLPQCEPVSLGEGLTPLIPFGGRTFVKDESLNPTGSFKARGMSVAVSMAKHFGFRALAVPSAGNAAGAMAAYAAAAGIEAHVFMPCDAPEANIFECELLGAKVTLIDGLITDCAAALKQYAIASKSFDVSTLREPYRVEGKKTMGYELFEQLGKLPDVIIYPTGGGTGLIGMWKAFDEMEELGWIGEERPKMVSVQAAGCAPIVTAYDKGERFADEYLNAHTQASGLRVPRAIGDFIMLDIIRSSKGTAIAVSDDDMLESAKQLAAATGVCVCPEGGATYAAQKRLKQSEFISDDDVVVLFNTGTGLKYAEALNTKEAHEAS